MISSDNGLSLVGVKYTNGNRKSKSFDSDVASLNKSCNFAKSVRSIEIQVRG